MYLALFGPEGLVIFDHRITAAMRASRTWSRIDAYGVMLRQREMEASRGEGSDARKHDHAGRRARGRPSCELIPSALGPTKFRRGRWFRLRA